MNELDLLVLGSGVAGLSAAVRAAEAGLSVGVLTKGELEQATTRWAQGGVAAALSLDPEELDLHLADTLAAGAGLCDPAAVRVLVDEGPRRVQELIALGAVFDMDEAGEFQLAREGGHSVPRILHAGGAATGREVERALVHAVKATAAAIHEQRHPVRGRCDVRASTPNQIDLPPGSGQRAGQRRAHSAAAEHPHRKRPGSPGRRGVGPAQGDVIARNNRTQLEGIGLGHPAFGLLDVNLGHQVRGQIAHRRQHKAAFLPADVRDGEVRIVQLHAIHPNDVDVEGPRAPALAAHAVGGALQAMA